MGWEADRILEGVFQFGAPINIWKMELDFDRWGDAQYFHIHMQFGDDAYVADRLDKRIRGETSIEYFPRLIIMEGPKTRSIVTTEWREWVFYKPWLDSLMTDYHPSQYPYENWPGWTVGIAFEKSKANRSSVLGLFGNERGKMFW